MFNLFSFVVQTMKMILKTLQVVFLSILATRAVKTASLVSGEKASWSEWKKLYQKSYANSLEEDFRRTIWQYSLNKSEEHNNMAEHSFTMGLNKFSDLTTLEYRYLMLDSKRWFGKKNDVNNSGFPAFNDLPKTVDWREQGCVSPVKNQGEHGQSWAFSATGSLEGRHCVVTKTPVELNVTKLAECCTTCHSVEDAFRYMISHNHIDNTLVHRHVGNQNCNFSETAYGASMSAYFEVPFGSESFLQLVVAKAGPISVTIDASHTSFQLYQAGIYKEPSCSTTQLDHAMLVVGYGTLNGEDYWLVKNSWGKSWGMNGYILMARNKDNQCGIASSALYPTDVKVGNFDEPILTA